MTSWSEMKYGPIGEAVERSLDKSEADPIGIYAAVLALYSSSLNGRVMLASGRPAVVWTVLAGKSALGRKGYALRTAQKILKPSIGGFMRSRSYSDITSGPSLVNLLYTLEMQSAGTETGMDGRALLVEEEWAGVLKRAKRCATFSQKLRTAWDGGKIANTTKDEPQEVESPLLGFHAHITPGEWRTWISGSDALGGSYNRILPVLVERSKILPHDHRATFEETKELTAAYKWASDEARYIGFDKEAGKRYDELRAILDDRLALLPENVSCYLERASEQIWRVAAVLVAAERKSVINRRALDAAWAFVEFSMSSVEKLVSDAASAKAAKSLPEVIRDVLGRYDGEASSTLMLRALGTRVTAASLRAAVEDMEDVEWYKDTSVTGRGAKPIMYRLISKRLAEKPVEVEEEKPRLAVVPQRTVKRPASKPTTKAAPPRKSAVKATPAQAAVPAAAAAPANPFAALL